MISTHTLHAERDITQNEIPNVPIKISTHTLHAERDDINDDDIIARDISTHTLHAERDTQNEIPNVPIKISTHTLHAERDPTSCANHRPAPQEADKPFIFSFSSLKKHREKHFFHSEPP